MVFNHVFHHIPTKYQSPSTYKIYLSAPDPTTNEHWNRDCTTALPILHSLFEFHYPEEQEDHESSVSDPDTFVFVERPEQGKVELSSNNPFKSSTKDMPIHTKPLKTLPMQGTDPLHTTTQPTKPVAEIVYMTRGDMKYEPVKLQALPTLVKWRDGKVVARIGGMECLDGASLEGVIGA